MTVEELRARLIREPGKPGPILILSADELFLFKGNTSMGELLVYEQRAQVADRGAFARYGDLVAIVGGIYICDSEPEKTRVEDEVFAVEFLASAIA